MVFLALALVSLFSFFSSSNRGTMDAFRETIAHSLAQEALEWVAALGHDKLLEMQETGSNALSGRLGLNSFVRVDSVLLDDGSRILYPEEYRQFERKIELFAYPAERLTLVRVTVQPWGEFSLRRGRVVREKLVGSEYD
jgi:hypothetical protein